MPVFAVRLRMPPRLRRLICAFWLAGLVATAEAELSDKIRAEILAPLPKFEPRPAEPPRPEASSVPPPPLSDDPLVKLPDYHINEKRVQDRDPDLWLSRRAIEHKAMSDYSDSMTDLEWFLNCWHIPLITPSAQARANAAYANNKMVSEHKRLVSIAKALSHLDSADAKKLLRDLDLSSHPGK